MFSFHHVEFGREKEKRKRVLLKRGQNTESGASPSIRPPEMLSWSAEEFFLQLRSLFLCV